MGAIGITLTAAGISFGNEWIQGKPNFRIVVAGFASALFLDGVEHIQPQLGRGLAYIMLTTVLLTPFNGKSPLQTLGTLTDTAPATADALQKKVGK